MSPKRVYGSYTLIGIIVVRVHDPPTLGFMSSPRNMIVQVDEVHVDRPDRLDAQRHQRHERKRNLGAPGPSHLARDDHEP